jgi:replicative DNA helicase
VSVAEIGPVPSGEPRFERTPPQDVAAEQSVLGGMLLSKDAIADVVEVLRVDDFYRPAHGLVYDTILDLYGRGEPADAVTVAAELTRRGEMARAGGAPYLHTLIASVPTAANAGYYATIVAEQAILRRLVVAGTRIVQMGYQPDAEIDDVVDRAQSEVYEVTERRTSEDFVPLREVLPVTWDELDAISNRNGDMVGVPTGFRELDELTNGLHPGQMVIIAGRPGLGKSTLALDVMRAASIKHDQTSVLFSLEMGRNEITMRLLSAEAKVSLHQMRTGNLSDDDWPKLARKMGEIAEKPLFIDDSPNLTMMEIRAKARRLKQRHDLKLVVIDYMQLMTSGKKVESRQQEVSEFSRSLKLLAKELDVPVIALSQLNRGPEQRTDKKPMLSDLRESGCLPASTRIIRADTNQEVTLGELFAAGARDVPVWSLDDSLRYVRRHMTHVFSTGVKQVFTMTLASGKRIRATGNHRFLTYDGWAALDSLAPGSRLAVPRHIPAPLEETPLRDEQVILLGHLIGDGSYLARQPLRYATADPANVAAVVEAAKDFGVTAKLDEYPAARCTTVRLPSPYPLTHGVRNPIVAWLDELGIFNQRSHEKRVPEALFSAPKRQVRLFLKHLWATDGSVLVNRSGRNGRVYYASTSRELCDDISRLLLRFGIATRLHVARKPGYRDGYHLDISGAEDQKAFLRQIGVHGARGTAAQRLLGILESVKPNPNVDTVPREVWTQVRRVLVERGMTHREFAAALQTQFCGSTMWKHSPSRERLGRIATVLDDSDLELMATNDVFWDEVVSIEPDGVEEVFDATVVGTHNFIADGVAVHNSLEQDADLVILLHREDVYERESPRAGEADLIVAKHRNGPVKTVTVAFQGHYSRFVDMQQG